MRRWGSLGASERASGLLPAGRRRDQTRRRTRNGSPNRVIGSRIASRPNQQKTAPASTTPIDGGRNRNPIMPAT